MQLRKSAVIFDLELPSRDHGGRQRPGGTSLCPTLSRSRDPPISRSLLIPVGPELTTSKGLQRKEPALEIVVYVWPVNRDPAINPASTSCCFPPLTTHHHHHQLLTVYHHHHHHPRPRALLLAQTLSLLDLRPPACTPTRELVVLS